MQNVQVRSRTLENLVSQGSRVELKLAMQCGRPLSEATGGGDDPAAAIFDDLSREVYCILGIPIDAVEMPAVLRSIEIAAASRTPFVISTPNLNFVVNSRKNTEFRESLLESDLCPVDGMPIVWIAQLLGIPVYGRTAGSDMVDSLKAEPRNEPLKVFLFGATESAAAAAAKTLDAGLNLKCVGWVCPKFGSVSELSADHLIDEINASGADFLMAALGAVKGQLWIQHNHRRLQVPIRAHLGAVINFQAGSVARAPAILQKLGLEWLWRIRQEPYLWRRYWNDGIVFLRLMVTNVIPLAVKAYTLRRRSKREGQKLIIEQSHGSSSVNLRFSGFATDEHVEEATARFREAMMNKKKVVIDLANTLGIDARFLGLLLMVRKNLKGRGLSLEIAGASAEMEKTFRLNGASYLLAD
jgi:N-acetylglucosaminyldiphosphoundecaprenol N-acetyl-beta-D-mannosaminyltransferase